MDSLTPPLSLLSATLHQQEADLNTKADVLNKHDLKLLCNKYYISAWRDRLLYPSTYLHTSQVDHLAYIQYDLQNNEWDEFKDTMTEFELKELPSNPRIKIVSDDNSSSW
ncbi:hypothetical protein BS47DRAFT_1388271 [Hydnum rufescens UP504]|uniref:Uncharacterized protein n=1 Tax=Hydnum rufescens UP504 TaxID=1448309 RepID=A0A9P6B7U8_9AGAM|nr:hypothetical protein BS47DRAFT_1388271 [Hydnum rufescens UP504]